MKIKIKGNNRNAVKRSKSDLYLSSSKKSGKTVGQIKYYIVVLGNREKSFWLRKTRLSIINKIKDSRIFG